MKKFISFLLLPCLLLCSCVSTEISASDTVSPEFFTELSEMCIDTGTSPAEPIDVAAANMSDDSLINANQIVALGDSIAYGYGLKAREREAFPFVLANSLTDGEKHYKCFNYAVNGHASEDMESDISAADRLDGDTDIVVISVGANNLLHVAKSELFKMISLDGRLILLLGGALSSDDAFSLLDIIAEAFRDTFTSNEFRLSAIAGIENLKADLPQFISMIKERSPDAEIYYQTIYNPYKGVVIPMPDGNSFDFGALCDEYIRMLNLIITENADTLGYRTVDVYNAFENSETRLVNVNLTGDGMFSLDPHPNKNGHMLIASVYKEAIKARSMQNN